MSNTSYRIHVLNTGDYYILAFDNSFEIGNTLINKTIQIYKEIDESIEHYDLKLNVSLREKEFIKSIFHQILPSHNLLDKMRNPEDVIHNITFDIKETIKFHKIQNYWSMITKEKVDKIDDSYEDMAISAGDISYASVNEKTDILPNDFRSQLLSPISSKKLDEYNPVYMILFHNIYNISIVVHDVFTNIKNVCDEFKEFEIVESFKGDTMMDKSIIEKLKIHFHKKSFETKNALTHNIGCFKTLYFECDDNFLLSQNKSNEKSEKDRVNEFFSENYVINTDPNQKISASELYKTVINNLCIGYDERSQFKKRLSGYLIEAGLTRKRYSEGYFYWGLQPINGKTDSIQDIVTKRTKDIQDYIPRKYVSDDGKI